MAIDHRRTDSLDHALAWRITRAARLLRVDLTRTLQPHGVSPEQFFVLFRLHEADGRAQGDLVDPALGDRANISRHVAGLEAQGLVERRPDPDDGRVRRVFLTPAGRVRIDALLAVAVAERQRLFGGLSDDELAALDRALQLIEARASLAPEP